MKQILLACTLLLSVFILDTSNLYAQQDYLHQPLKSEGKIPSAFLNTVKENYAINSQTRTDSDLDDFNVISGYAINELLWSGKIVFGDTVTRYLNRIVDVILKDDPTLRNKIQIYTVKSTVVNAFTTSEGFVFVNLGLIASCENEAQLAYILSHEISHYVKQHSVNRYTYKKQEEKNANKFTWNSSKREKIDYTKRLNVSNYSKTQEIEADDYGLELFSKTAYNQNASVTGFEMLGASDSLRNNFSFKKEYFTNDYLLNFDDSLLTKRKLSYSEIGEWIHEEAEIQDEDEEEEEDFSTHPNIDERIKNVSQKIDDKQNETSLYLVGTKQEFENIQKVANYEVLQIQLLQAKYIDAIYKIVELNQKYGQNPSNNAAMAKAMYGVAKYGNVKAKVSMNYDYKEIDWKDKNWYEALGNLSKVDRTIFAFTYLFSNLDNKIDTSYTKRAITDLLADVYIYHDELLKDSLETDMKSFDSVWVNKIRKNPHYEDFLKKAKVEFDDYQEWEDFKNNEDKMYDYRQRLAKARYHGFELGIDDIMITDVRYLKMNVNKGKVAPLKTMINKEDYAIQSIKKSAEKLDLNTLILDPRALSKNDITLAIFNDLATVNDWYAAQSDVEDMYTFVPSNHVEIEEVAKRNGTKHFVRMAMLDLKGASNDYKGIKAYFALFTLPTIYFLPYTYYRIFSNKEAIVLTEIYDINRGRPLVIYNVSGMSLKKTNMQQNIFFQLSQIKSK